MVPITTCSKMVQSGCGVRKTKLLLDGATFSVLLCDVTEEDFMPDGIRVDGLKS